MKKLSSILILIIVIAAIAGVFWFAGRFGGGEDVKSEKPTIVCKEDECFWTAHMHATVKIFDKGEQVNLTFEQGKLEEEHTHSDQGKLHWHGLIPVDPGNREVKDWSALKVENLPKDLGLKISGEPKFIVNGKEVKADYIWKDGDNIEIRYE